MAVSGDLVEKFPDHLETKFRMRHFASTEFQGDFDLHVLAQKVDPMLDFDREVVGIDLRTKLDFLNARGVLVFLGFLVAFGLFVSVLAEIDQTADGRIRVGGDLNQVNAISASHGQRVTQAEDPELFAINPDDPNFAGTNFPVYPDERSRRRRRT